MSSETWNDFARVAGGDASFADVTWDSYRVSEENRVSVALIRGIQFRDSFGAFIHGPAGTGKTHAMKARFHEYIDFKVAAHLAGRQTPARCHWVTCSAYLEAMRSDDHGARNRLRERIQTVTTLFLDDLGTSTKTEWAVDQLLLVLDFRASRGLQTFITSNLTLEEIGTHYGQRLSSRIAALCVPVPLVGSDARARIMIDRMGELAARVAKKVPVP